MKNNWLQLQGQAKQRWRLRVVWISLSRRKAAPWGLNPTATGLLRVFKEFLRSLHRQLRHLHWKKVWLGIQKVPLMWLWEENTMFLWFVPLNNVTKMPSDYQIYHEAFVKYLFLDGSRRFFFLKSFQNKKGCILICNHCCKQQIIRLFYLSCANDLM